MITEDFAYERLWEQAQYLKELRTRAFSDYKRKWEVCRSAIFIYWRWKDEVRKFQNIKRSLMTTIVICVSMDNDSMEPNQLDYLKSRMNIMMTKEFGKNISEITVEQVVKGKKKITGTTKMETNEI